MLQSYKAVLKGNQLEWIDERKVSASNQPILVYVTLLKEEPPNQQPKLPRQPTVNILEEIADLDGAESQTVFDPDDEMIESAMNGTLELLNINRKNRLFNLYPVVGATKIICDFPSTLLQKAIAAIDHYVNVVGQYKYKSGHPHPYYVKVTDIEIYPDEKELPSLFDLRGIAPNATNNLSSEDFIRERRDEW
jgi:hypothetical protein